MGTRFDRPDDFVRNEIEGALRRGVPILPVLVRGAKLPPQGVLPETMASMLGRQAMVVRPDPDFHADVQRLIAEVERAQRGRDLAEGLVPVRGTR